MGVPIKWEGGDDIEESSVEETSDNAENEEDEDEQEDEGSDSDESETEAPAKGRGAKAKAKAKAGKKPVKKNVKTKDSKPKTKAKKAKGSRVSRKGDQQLFRYSSWRAVPESHIRDFLSHAEPRAASSIKTAELSGRDLRRVFFGYFRLPPGRKPDKKKKGDIKKDLVNEYEALGRPGAGKCLQQVMQDVEDEMSKNLAFKIEKSGKCIWLHCGKRKVQLKEGWKLQIFKEPSGIPFLSTGKVSKRCVRFFDDEKEEEARTKDASVEVAAVPLPGAPTPSTAAPSATEADQGESAKSEKKPVCHCNYFREKCDDCGKGWMTEISAGRACHLGDGTGPAVPDSPSPSLPDSDADDETNITSEVMQDSIDGHKVLKLEKKVFLLRRGDDNPDDIEAAQLDSSCPDWKLTKNTNAGKHQNELFIHSPSQKAKACWVNKMKFEPLSESDFNDIKAFCKARREVEKTEGNEKKAEEQKRQDEDHKKAEEEKTRQEEDHKKAEEEKKRQEEDHKKAEEKKRQEEEDRKKAEEKKRQEEEDRKKAEEEKKRQDEDHKKAEEEKKRQEEEDQKKIEEEKRAQMEKEFRAKYEQELRAKIEGEYAEKLASLPSRADTENVPAAMSTEGMKPKDETKIEAKGKEAEEHMKADEKQDAGESTLKDKSNEKVEPKEKSLEEQKKSQEDIINANKEEAKKRKQAKEDEQRAGKKAKIPP